MFDFNNCVMKITSKSLIWHLVKLQQKLKQNETVYIFISFYYVFQYSSMLVIS